MSHVKPTNPLAENPESVKCGIVMPISQIEDCSAAHWAEVLTIVKESLSGIHFDASLVSYADESGIIQARIIQRLAEDPIVICDVSAKNPNVMFELGLRLAFDKATVIIKDDKTNYSFDTSVIEHINYPRDLHYHKIQEFKAELAAKAKATHERASADPTYSTFLKHFGKLTPKSVPVGEEEFSKIVLQELSSLRAEVNSIGKKRPEPQISGEGIFARIFLRGDRAAINSAVKKMSVSGVFKSGYRIESSDDGQVVTPLSPLTSYELDTIVRIATQLGISASWS